MDLHEYIETKENNIRQIVVCKDGRTIYEDYWHGFKPTDTLHVMSATKSIVSLLFGIALDQRFIKSIDQNVLDFFPDYCIKRGEKTIQKVTIRHLLTMTAPYKGKSEPWSKVCSSDDWTKTSLDYLGGRTGITGEFRYTTVCLQILTGILAKASQMTTCEFANKYLFAPLDIAPYHNYLAATAEEHRAFILSAEPKTNLWFGDPLEVGAAGYGLCMSSVDMAKVGQLCLDGGVYQGKCVVSSSWIAESTKPRIQCEEQFGNMQYGYLWWTPDHDKTAYAALGNSGNVIYVNPSNHSVVAVTGTFKPRVLDRVQFIQKFIEPLL